MNYYSETRFYKEIKRGIKDGKKMVQVADQNGLDILLEESYLENLNSHSKFETTEKLSRTEIIEKFLNNPRTVCSVYAKKQDKPKLVRDFKAEKAAKIREVQSATLTDAAKLLENLIDNPISKIIPGEMRLFEGYHFGEQNDRGRMLFTDMCESDPVRATKQVDLRTIEYLIVNKVKYIVK